MIRGRHYFLFVTILLFIPQLSSAGSYRVLTEPPLSEDFCLYCKTDEACQLYASDSVCKRGQCTDQDGLFGRGCNCKGETECNTGRCDGLFEKICLEQLDIGQLCNEASDCKSGRCSDMGWCREPLPTEAPVIDGQETETAGDVTGPSSSPTTAEENLFVKGCHACTDDSECFGGTCVRGICADAAGVHPPACATCRGDDQCTDGYFCHGLGVISRSGKKCALKRVNGASCARNEACRSGHCNVLFNCESEIPERHRDSTLSDKPFSATEEGRSGFPGLVMWISILGALVLFGVSMAILCQKDGLRRFLRLRADHNTGRGRLGSDTLDSEIELEMEDGGKCPPTLDVEAKLG